MRPMVYTSQSLSLGCYGTGKLESWLIIYEVGRIFLSSHLKSLLNSYLSV